MATQGVREISQSRRTAVSSGQSGVEGGLSAVAGALIASYIPENFATSEQAFMWEVLIVGLFGMAGPWIMSEIRNRQKGGAS